MDLKTKNARMRTESAANQLQQLAKLNEIQGFIRLAGGNPALWDYPAGTTVMTAGTGNAATASFPIPHEFMRNGAFVRIVTTVGATPTATYAIQGAMADVPAQYANLLYADYLTPGTLVSSNLVITTAATFIKYIPAGQNVRWLRVNVTLNTNVTSTIDFSYL